MFDLQNQSWIEKIHKWSARAINGGFENWNDIFVSDIFVQYGLTVQKKRSHT